MVDASQQPSYKPSETGADKLGYNQQEFELQVNINLDSSHTLNTKIPSVVCYSTKKWLKTGCKPTEDTDEYIFKDLNIILTFSVGKASTSSLSAAERQVQKDECSAQKWPYSQ